MRSTSPLHSHPHTKKQASSAHRVASAMRFVGGFLRHPLRNASLVPSSRTLTHQLLEGLPLKTAQCVVELGPGVGTFTGEILARLSPTAKLVVIDIEPTYCTHLRDMFGNDTRLIVVEGSCHMVESILQTHGLVRPDIIISGLGFPSLPSDVRQKTVECIRAYTKAGTQYRMFTYMPRTIRRIFADTSLAHRTFTWRNFPPAHTFGIN